MSRALICKLCRVFALALALPLASLAAEPPGTTDVQADQALSNAVVKIWTTRLTPDLVKPWNKQSSSSITGSGVVIEGRRILTNAHVALYASQIQVQANGSGDKLSARVEAIAPGIDLAVLKLEDESFFNTHAPMLRASGLPAIKEPVLAYGFPTGGDSQSVTKGIVSRIEFVNYRYQVAGLRIQIDAAINPGNSGGPVVSGDKMIGLTFSNIPSAQNIGYIIPNEEIEIFLKDIADGRYDGKPSLFDTFQPLENPALRAFLKLDKDTKGVVTYKPLRSDAGYPLKKWDVLTHIGDTPVDAQGMVSLDNGLRVGMRYMVQKLARNGSVPVTVVRAGKSINLQLPAPASVNKLIPELAGSFPPYFIYGPIAFTKATADLLPGIQTATPTNPNIQNSMVAWSVLGSPLVTLRSEESTPDREELVMVTGPFFSHKITNGYKNMSFAVIKTVNGTAVRSLAHLVALLRDMKEPFVTFETQMQGGEAVIFSHQDMLSATEEVLSSSGIRAQGSDALMKVWRGQAAR